MPPQPPPDSVSVTTALLRDWPLPAPGGGKESRGRTLIVGGSAETAGAVLLAAEAALRCGAGKLQIGTAESVAFGLSLSLPEALVRGLAENKDGSISASTVDQLSELLSDADSVLVGPGLADAEQAARLTRSVIEQSEAPLVVDALALAAVTEDATCLAGREAVLTPNPRELALTLHTSSAEVDEDPAGAALELASRAGVVVSVGGETSYVASPDGRLWADTSGSVGLGVSGSGDVRAGIVAGLLARGAEPEQAAVWAAQLHGRAGERLASTVGRLGFLARELPSVVPAILLEIEQ
jgi:ADP-dependent NAD(P)H-hydrate dehydratase